MSERDDFGAKGERLAEAFLRRVGMRLLARRYRRPMGEIDLIFAQTETIVFVEVKTQRSAQFIDPHERVTRTKKARLLRAARCFIGEKKLDAHPCRFDVVTVLLPESGDPTIRHVRDAFIPSRW